MKTDIDHHLTRIVAVVLALGTLVACDPPECIDGPSNLTPKAVAKCVAPPAGTSPEDEIVSAGAELRNDGTLALTWSSQGLECGTSADEVEYPEDCQTSAWTITVEIPPELAVPGVIDLADHPEVLGSFVVIRPLAGVSWNSGLPERRLVGSLELVSVGEACVTGVLHGFGSGEPDPTLGGPELDGSFVAPRC
jgi:hypothetical protein